MLTIYHINMLKSRCKQRSFQMSNRILKSRSQTVKDCRNKNYDMIQFSVPKGDREAIKAHAESMHESMNEFIRRSIVNQIKSDLVHNVTVVTINTEELAEKHSIAQTTEKRTD